MMSYQALIVDDETLAREGIRDLLASDPEVKVCALCKNGADASKPRTPITRHCSS